MKKTEPSMQINRRKLIKTLAGGSALGTASMLGALTPLTNALAQSRQGYRELTTPMLTDDRTSVEVLEFFWFGCPHCFAFEPTIIQWQKTKPEYVSFVREAPPLNPGWEPHSRMFYAAQALGITDGMFDQTFDQIHKKRQPLRSPKNIGKFVESLDLGVSADKFVSTMNSFAVESALKKSMLRAHQTGITGVPSLVINGKYVTGNSLAGSHEGIIQVINELAEREHNAV